MKNLRFLNTFLTHYRDWKKKNMSCDPDGTHAKHFVTSDLVQPVFQTNKMRAELPSSNPAQTGRLCRIVPTSGGDPQPGGPFQNLDTQSSYG